MRMNKTISVWLFDMSAYLFILAFSYTSKLLKIFVPAAGIVFLVVAIFWWEY